MKLSLHIIFLSLFTIYALNGQDPCLRSLPFFEDFESVSTIPQDECWSTDGTAYNGPESYAPWDIYFGTNRSVFAEYWQGQQGDKFILRTPSFDFSDEEGGTLAFDWQSNGASHSGGDYFKVKLSTDGGASYTTIWFNNGDNMQGGTCSSNTWPNGEWVSSGPISLPGVAGRDDVKILFEMDEDPIGWSSGRVFIDNIYVGGIVAFTDAQVSASNISNYYSNGELLSPIADVSNLGYDVIDVDVTLEISDGSSNVFRETITSVSIANGATEKVYFPDWTAVSGSYSYSVRVSDPGGDVNILNNELIGSFDVGALHVNEIGNTITGIYPNPSNGIFSVELTSDLKLAVFDTKGIVVKALNLKSGKTIIEIKNKGFYFLRFSNGMVEKIYVN
jgi:hypothetical protein